MYLADIEACRKIFPVISRSCSDSTYFSIAPLQFHLLLLACRVAVPNDRLPKNHCRYCTRQFTSLEAMLFFLQGLLLFYERINNRRDESQRIQRSRGHVSLLRKRKHFSYVLSQIALYATHSLTSIKYKLAQPYAWQKSPPVFVFLYSVLVRKKNASNWTWWSSLSEASVGCQPPLVWQWWEIQLKKPLKRMRRAGQLSLDVQRWNLFFRSFHSSCFTDDPDPGRFGAVVRLHFNRPYSRWRDEVPGGPTDRMHQYKPVRMYTASELHFV